MWARKIRGPIPRARAYNITIGGTRVKPTKNFSDLVVSNSSLTWSQSTEYLLIDLPCILGVKNMSNLLPAFYLYFKSNFCEKSSENMYQWLVLRKLVKFTVNSLIKNPGTCTV